MKNLKKIPTDILDLVKRRYDDKCYTIIYKSTSAQGIVTQHYDFENVDVFYDKWFKEITDNAEYVGMITHTKLTIELYKLLVWQTGNEVKISNYVKFTNY